MTSPKSAAQAAERSTAFRTTARVGYVVLGIVHIVIGAIAISVALGGGGEADHGGAMEQIRQAPAGSLLLWLIALGLAALAVWQVAEALVERNPDTAKKWGYRAKYVGTALIYLAIAGTALVYALGGQSDSSQSTQSFSAQLMAAPGGLFLVGLIGLGVAAIGAAFIIRGFTRAFVKYLDLPADPAGRGIVMLGVVGYIVKGIAVAITGILFIVAAFTQNPQAASGPDGALHALAALPLGTVILWAVGAGVIVYGVYCFALARYARM